jgi:hypothetical protein
VRIIRSFVLFKHDRNVGFRVALPNLRVWLNLLGFVVFELAVFEFDEAIGDVEVMIVMANYEYGFAARS